MNLHIGPFELIKSGQKDIEMRLYDERRRSLKIGDEIVFTNNETDEKITVEIINLYRFKDFHELYSHFPKERLGYVSDQPANPEDMEIYYSKEKIKEYGVIAIEIKLK